MNKKLNILFLALEVIGCIIALMTGIIISNAGYIYFSVLASIMIVPTPITIYFCTKQALEKRKHSNYYIADNITYYQ